jgi:membrane-bound hydrogenase subunit beta
MIISAEELLEKFKEEFGDKILETKLREQTKGAKTKKPQKIVWIKINGETLHDAVAFLKDIYYPHAAAPMTHKIHGEQMELIYPLTIYGGQSNFSELPVIFQVMLSKDNPSVQSIADLIPGMDLFERETIEMVGVNIIGAKDKRRIFTPHHMDEIEKGMKPRRDDLGFGYDDFYKKRKIEENE